MSRAAHLLAGLTLLSRVGGLMRDMAVSAMFGTGTGADAFFVAFRIPNLFRRVVAEGASSAAMVPVFTDSLVRGGKAEAARAAGAVGGAAFLVLGLVTLAGMVGAAPLTALFAPGFARDPAKMATTVSLTRWIFPYLLLVGGAAWAMGILHTFRRFAVPALGPVLLNLVVIAAALGLAPHLARPEYALVAGVLVGGLLQFLVQVPTLYALGLRPRMLADLAHPAVRRTGRLVASVVLGGAVYQINILVATVFASLLPDRSVSYLWYADRVFEFPLGIVAVAVGTAALPSLSAQAKAGRSDAMADTIVHSLSLVLAFCLPAAIGLLLLAPDIVTLLFQRGRFSAEDAQMTAWALRAYVPGLLGVAAIRVLAAGFYAVEQPRAPVYAALAALFVNAFFDLALMGPLAVGNGAGAAAWLAAAGDAVRIADLRHAGLALANGIAATTNAALLLVMLRRRLPALKLGPLGRSLALHGLATAAMAALLLVLHWAGGAQAGPGLWGMLSAWLGRPSVRVAVGVGLGGLAYLGTAILLGSPQVRELVSLLLGRLGRASARESSRAGS